ncbi:trypsin-like peptidase domain-containing protein [Albidovulum sp.]|jgi:Do/DeqQ family serine protease|uniref:trypsin-like peptidase domain-containing protein n=1 Tax=Albidovulum sp. TaxID=1872424 RepID=UPI00302286B8
MRPLRLTALPLLAALAALALAAPAAAETRVPADGAEIALSFAPVVRAAAPAVVSIYARRIVAARPSPFADDPFFSRFFDLGPTVPRVQNALGSGVILRGDGIVVTNFHVVADADEIRVVLADAREFDGEVILADRDLDLAVIRLQGARDLPALALADSDGAAVGDLVLAIGNPFGVGQTVTSGIVSALARAGRAGGPGAPESRQGYFIQTDAAVNPGNSGGALVDLSGRLLGINTMIVSRSGGSNGIGFAIPANLVGQYVAQAEAGASRFVRPWAGIDVQPVDMDLAEALGLPAPGGVVIRALHAESPFAAAGFRTGDVITLVDGHAVNGPAELDYRLTVLGPGGTARVAWRRNGAEAVASVALSPAPPGAEPLTLGAGSAFAGLTLAPLDAALIDRLGLPLATTGVVVAGVAGPARGTGLRPGDVLVAINGTPVSTPPDVAGLAAPGARDWTIELLRNGQRAVLRLSGD